MSSVTEHLVRGADNAIILNLQEDDENVTGAWTGLDVFIGYPTALVTLTRTAPADGITFVGGVLTIKPAQLDAAEITAIDALDVGVLYRTVVKVITSANPNGAYFGEGDSNRLYLLVSDPP